MHRRKKSSLACLICHKIGHLAKDYTDRLENTTWTNGNIEEIREHMRLTQCTSFEEDGSTSAPTSCTESSESCASTSA